MMLKSMFFSMLISTILNLSISSSLKMMDSRACFGAGCYWGTEKFIKVDFGKRWSPGSIKKGAVGFMGPVTSKPNPTYREVCSGMTGHVEVYDCEFDGNEKTYEKLVRHFFSFHDPTTMNQQGNDKGTQYASVIFCYDQKQTEIATKVKGELQELLTKGKVRNYQSSYDNNDGDYDLDKKKGWILNYQEKFINTAITDATTFYIAQGDHQSYLEKNPYGYCNHAYRFNDWPK